jgi:hypothetical protein
MANPTWHGTQSEAFELQQCLTDFCTCEYDQQDGHRTTTCAPHRMLNEDQKALDGLLFMRWMKDRLKREEFGQ